MASAAGRNPPRIALVLKGYPRLSETFIAQEIRGLELRGLALEIVSLRHPYDPAIHPIHEQIEADVRYLPEYLYQEPLRVLKAWWRARRLPGYPAVRALWLKDLWRDMTANRVRRFGQALVFAAEMPATIGLIYVHYLHTPASVARYTALLRGLPFSASAHAKDIWTSPDWELKEKLEDCRWLTTCTRVNRRHLADLAPGTEVFLTYHGLDAERFPAPERQLGPDGSSPEHPVQLLGVARLVAKKGVGTLLDALHRLPPDLHWRYVHIGRGDETDRLTAKAQELGLADRIDWQGAQSQEQVISAYRRADLFVMASRIAEDGDRDGLPNVLMEAGSQELAAVTTSVSAVPELITDGDNGLLVPPDDAEALAAALETLARDPQQRLAMGRTARRTVLERFAMDPGLDTLAARLRQELATPQRQAA
ncbi:MAG: glycosyltransferase family 4 protein [Alphaproteobacteria bacterium]